MISEFSEPLILVNIWTLCWVGGTAAPQGSILGPSPALGSVLPYSLHDYADAFSVNAVKDFHNHHILSTISFLQNERGPQ